MVKNSEFYDNISSNYDDMINFKESIKRKIELYREFFGEKGQTVADIGCGTGLDTAVLLNLGYEVTSFEPSNNMLLKAEENLKSEGFSGTLINCGGEEIPEEYNNKFGLIVSLGNTIANIPKDSLVKTIKTFYNILKDEGKVVIQILNYKKILKEQKKIIGIGKKEEEVYLRTYDFHNGYLEFNIIHFNINNTKEYSINTTKIYPYTDDEIIKIFTENKFSNISMYGSFKKDKYDANKSNDLIIVTNK